MRKAMTAAYLIALAATAACLALTGAPAPTGYVGLDAPQVAGHARTALRGGRFAWVEARR